MQYCKGINLYELDGEKRLLEWGVKPDGEVYIFEKCEGDLTEFAYDAKVHMTEISFMPTESYGIGDVEGRAEDPGDDCYIDDFTGALGLWNIPYTQQVTDTHISA
ncbi:MAG: hypothetical protein ACFWTL_09860 [Atopobium sp.]|jgi:hypothetical protein